MNLFRKARLKLGITPTDRLVKSESELMYYEFVARRLDSGVYEKGIWAMALAQSQGDDEKAKGRYIELAVERLKKEVSAGIGLYREFNRFQDAYLVEVKKQQKIIKQISKQEMYLEKTQLEADALESAASGWAKITVVSGIFMIFTGGLTALIAVPALTMWLTKSLGASSKSRDIGKAQTLLNKLENDYEQLR